MECSVVEQSCYSWRSFSSGGKSWGQSLCVAHDLRLIPAHLIDNFPLPANTLYSSFFSHLLFVKGVSHFLPLCFSSSSFGGASTVVDITSGLRVYSSSFFLSMGHCCPPMENCMQVCYSLQQKVKLSGVSTFMSLLQSSGRQTDLMIWT